MLSFSRMSWGHQSHVAVPPPRVVPGWGIASICRWWSSRSHPGLWAAPTLGDGRWRERSQPWMAAGAPGPGRYLEAPARAVLGQDADVRGVGAGTDEAGQMLVLDIPHLRWGRVWDQAHATSHPTQGTLGWASPSHHAEPGSTYVLQLEQDLARQLDALTVEVLHGHEVALGRHGVMGAWWGDGGAVGWWVPGGVVGSHRCSCILIPCNTPSWRRPGTAPPWSSASRSWSPSAGSDVG